MIVWVQVSPGRRIIEGKVSWWTESGKCWASGQNPVRFA
jgi:hypothetical protein